MVSLQSFKHFDAIFMGLKSVHHEKIARDRKKQIMSSLRHINGLCFSTKQRARSRLVVVEFTVFIGVARVALW